MQTHWRRLALLVAVLIVLAAVGCSRGGKEPAPEPDGGGAAPGSEGAGTEPPANPPPATAGPLTAEAAARQAASVLQENGWKTAGSGQAEQVTLPAQLEPDLEDLAWGQRAWVMRDGGADLGSLAGRTVWQAALPLAGGAALPAYNRAPGLTGTVLLDDGARVLGAWVEAAAQQSPWMTEGPVDRRPLSLAGRTAWEAAAEVPGVKAGADGARLVGPFVSWMRSASGHWSPDGSRLVIWAAENGWWEFYAYDPAGGELTRFWRWDERDAMTMPVGWLDDGSLLVMADSQGILSIWAVDTAGGGARQVSRSEHGQGMYKSHFLAGDGRELVVHVPGKLLAFDLASGAVRTLYDGLPGWDGLYMVRPSPDGAWVALPEVEEAALLLVEVQSGRRVTALAKGAEFSIWDYAWSPDGQHVAVKLIGGQGVQEVEAGDFYHYLTPEVAVVNLAGERKARWVLSDTLVTGMVWKDPGHLLLATVPGQSTYQDIPSPVDFLVAPLGGGPPAPYAGGDYDELALERWDRPFPMAEGEGAAWRLEIRDGQESGQAPYTWMVLTPRGG